MSEVPRVRWVCDHSKRSTAVRLGATLWIAKRLADAEFSGNISESIRSVRRSLIDATGYATKRTVVLFCADQVSPGWQPRCKWSYMHLFGTEEDNGFLLLKTGFAF